MSKKKIIRILVFPLLAEGETAPFGDLLGMQFYVEGIDSQFPN